MNQEESNEKILELMNKEDNLSEKEIQLFKELIFECDLKIRDKNKFTPLIYAFSYNNIKGLNINEKQINYLIKNSDLKQKDCYGYTPLMIFLYYNQSHNLNLNQEQINYLIKNSDLKVKDKSRYTSLMYALQYNKSQNLNLNKEQWDYLIKNSALKQKNNKGWIPLMYALTNNKDKNLKLTINQFQEMYDALDEEEQQTTFQKFIQEHFNNSKKYQKEINILLYDIQFKPNQETIHWLTEKKHQDILEMIEKRNLFFQLNQDFKEMNHHQKIATIKL